jgi:serine/threonine protein kinase
MEPRTFGKYTLLGRLGGGGMAEVFRAQWSGPEGFKKDLAVKLILPQFCDDPDFVKMFIQEATLAARLDHANIVRIYEFDKVENQYYIAMELVDGKDLRQILARSREIGVPPSIPQAVCLVLEICQGLAFAHGELTQGVPEIVHRDVSPHNIILSRAGEVKITDFGIAKLASAESVTRTGVIKGKVSYMSPEQARGQSVNRQSDVFAVGCILWEMLTGRRLFNGDNELAILEKLQRGDIVAPGSLCQGIPSGLDEVVLRALQRNRDLRYPSAPALMKDLQKVLRGYPDVDRSSVLVQWYRELYPEFGEKKGTDRLPLAVRRPEKMGDIEPVGPDVTTKTDDLLLSSSIVTLEKKPFWRKERRVSRSFVMGTMGMAVLLVGGWIWFSNRGGEESERGRVVLKSDEKMVLKEDPFAWMEVNPPTASGENFSNKGNANFNILENGTSKIPTDKETVATETTKKEPKGVHGFLQVNAIPWADVYLGKKYLGETPINGLALAPGEYILMIRNRRLGKEKNIKVTIQANRKTIRTIDLRNSEP